MPELPDGLDGPRGARPEEIPAVVALCDAAFRFPPYTTSMADDYPLLFAPENADDLRVIAGPDGAILAHVGLYRGEALVHGVRLPVAGMGAVATRADWRGRGLATALVADALARLGRAGVAVLIISGGRGLYLRAGAAPVGACLRWTVSAQAAAQLADGRFAVVSAADDLDQLIALHLREPVRRRRTRREFAALLRAQGYAVSIQCRPVTLGVTAAGDSELLAYAVLGIPDRGERRPRDTAYVVEYAGERAALAGALAAALRQTGTARAVLHTLPGDRALAARLRAAGLRPEAQTLPGTCAVPRPDVLAAAAAPLWAELGAGPWTVEPAGGGAWYLGGPDGRRLLPDGAAVAAALLGAGPQAVRDPGLPPPVPLPWPNGLDYV